MLFLRNLFGVSYSVIALVFWYLFSYSILIRDKTFLSFIDERTKQLYLYLYVLDKTDFFFVQTVVFLIAYLATCVSIYLVLLGLQYENSVNIHTGNYIRSHRTSVTLKDCFVISNNEFFLYRLPTISKITSYVVIVLLMTQAISGTGLIFITTSLLLVSLMSIFLAFMFSVFKHLKYYCKLKVYYYENQLRYQKQNQV
jgi:hypothetical protein